MLPVDIQYLFNNKGITTKKNYNISNLSLGGYSFPKEMFEANYHSEKFLISDGSYDNFTLEFQKIRLPKKSKKISFLGCSSDGEFSTEINLISSSSDSKETYTRTFPDFLSEEASIPCIKSNYIYKKNKGVLLIESRLWIIEILSEVEFDIIEFSLNPSIHIFALNIN